MKTVLKLFGLDPKKPVEFLFKVLGLIDNDRLLKDLEKAMCLNMTDKRRKEVADKLKAAAGHLEEKDCPAFAKTLVELIKGIKF